MRKRGQRSRILFYTMLFFFLAGCATTSLFTSYPQRIQPVKQQIAAKQYTPVLEQLDKHRDDKDKVLFMMERGRVSQMAQEYKVSIEDFKLVIEEFKIQDDKAKISVSDTGSQTAALLTNDNAIPYAGYGYERVFVHQFQALNYLFNNDLPAALVEVRRANLEQHEALRAHEDEVAKAEEKQREQSTKNKSFMDAFKSLQSVAGHVKNSFQNAYTFYVSGIIYEANGDDNDAYIDYKKALEIFTDNPHLQRDVLRLAKKLGMREDYERFSKQFSVSEQTPTKGEGELIVLFEHGYAPVKQEVKVPLFVITKLEAIAFPTYVDTWRPIVPLELSADGTALGKTEPIVFVQALSARALQEKLPGMMLRQVLRVAAKSEMAHQTGKAFGDLAQLGTTLFNLASERADLRSWLTLPNDAQIFRGTLSAGDHRLALNNGLARDSVELKIVSGKKTLLRVISTEQTMHVSSVVI